MHAFTRWSRVSASFFFISSQCGDQTQVGTVRKDLCNRTCTKAPRQQWLALQPDHCRPCMGQCASHPSCTAFGIGLEVSSQKPKHKQNMHVLYLQMQHRMNRNMGMNSGNCRQTTSKRLALEQRQQQDEEVLVMKVSVSVPVNPVFALPCWPRQPSRPAFACSSTERILRFDFGANV